MNPETCKQRGGAMRIMCHADEVCKHQERIGSMTLCKPINPLKCGDEYKNETHYIGTT